MYYSIRHVTRFRYSVPISESVMEVRMRPLTEGNQRCLEFQLQTNPGSQVQSYRDYIGNTIHHFDVAGKHAQLTITAEALVHLTAPDPLPDMLPVDAWAELDAMTRSTDYWDMLMPSHFARLTPLLEELIQDFQLKRRDDPLTLLRDLTEQMSKAFAYVPQSTRVDSPIDEALRKRAGVCQDFAHIMTALVRWLGIPCRYVSGYLFHRKEDHDRSEEDATHAWVEAFLPELGWVGFDPTNNLVVGERHIRTAVGRDYNDVSPTRGVFKGDASSELDVGVQVSPTQAPPPVEEMEELVPAIEWSPADPEEQDEFQQQQQQQQQQQ